MRINYAIVFVSDMQRSVAFYRDIVGIPVKFETPHWTEFLTEGSTLALHISKASASTDAGSDTEAPGTCKTGFQVPDIEEFHERMNRHNVDCIQPPTSTFGTKIAQYRDPDGMIFSIGQA